MNTELDIDGRDISLQSLRPLHQRPINLKSNAGFRKIVSSIQAIGLIEPLAVYPESKAGPFVILDGYLRYKACEALGIATVPCLVYRDMQAYSYNRNVNRLSSSQEMRMLRKSLQTLEESTIAKTFGIKSIRYRLAPKLVQNLHPQIVRAFKDDQISKICAMHFTYVLPERQVQILEEMRRNGDYSQSFCRSLVLSSALHQRSKNQPRLKRWDQNEAGKNLIDRLEKVEQQHDFYATLYRQYSTDLLRITFYIRQLVTNSNVAAYLKNNHPNILTRFNQLVLDTSG